MIWEINFDSPENLERVIIDTVANPANVWRIGHPAKTVFTSAHTNPNAIVTDTLHPYPAGDTSSFIIIHQAESGWATGYPKVDIGGWYYVDSDTLTDYGYIEFSRDHGTTWTRVDSSLGDCTWGATAELPTFTGNSYGWKHFYYCLQVNSPVNPMDTILYRFTFISDGIQTNRDGLMFDNLHFEDWAEGVNEIRHDGMITLAPNPVSGALFIRRAETRAVAAIRVYSRTGELLYHNEFFRGGGIDTRDLPDGLYLLNYSDGKRYAVKKFMVQR
jgi:hypothetical protein